MNLKKYAKLICYRIFNDSTGQKGTFCLGIIIGFLIDRIEHQRLHEKHRGHEAMHLEMVLILIATLVVAQIVLVQWKQRHFKSFQVSSYQCYFTSSPSKSVSQISSVTQCLISVIFQKLLFVNNISLQRATLLGMWLIPVGFCLKFGWHRFIYVWSIFSVITAFITFKATRKPISGSTPRYA